MRRHVVLIALALLSVQAGCSSVTLDPRKSEFWIGGTVDATDRARLARADTAQKLGAARMDMYLDCVQSYAVAHASASATPGDIADAAAASCAEHVGPYVDHYREADTLRIAAAHLRPADQIAMRDRIEADIDDVTQRMRERGRQLAIKAVVEHRP